mmetsp:Transcript_10132/g.29978  ORF Transcript_10132/g.29978 Transcript_10132/m.29978 type:complete len:243 (+) Transcript_10132:262-990(+)
MAWTSSSPSSRPRPRLRPPTRSSQPFAATTPRLMRRSGSTAWPSTTRPRPHPTRSTSCTCSSSPSTTMAPWRSSRPSSAGKPRMWVSARLLNASQPPAGFGAWRRAAPSQRCPRARCPTWARSRPPRRRCRARVRICPRLGLSPPRAAPLRPTRPRQTRSAGAREAGRMTRPRGSPATRLRSSTCSRSSSRQSRSSTSRASSLPSPPSSTSWSLRAPAAASTLRPCATNTRTTAASPSSCHW